MMITLPFSYPSTRRPPLVSEEENERYSEGNHKILSPSNTTQSFVKNNWGLGWARAAWESADKTQPEGPSRVYRSLPVVASQSLMVLSNEPEAMVWPSGEKATDSTKPEWPSSVRSLALHKCSTCGKVCIPFDRSTSKTCLIQLFIGEKISPAQYSCSGAISIIWLSSRINRLAS